MLDLTLMTDPRPFTIDVPSAQLDALRERLALSRFPSYPHQPGWQWGPDEDYLRSLVQYWREDFDWYAQQRRLNEFAHFKAAVQGRDIHFIHARSSHADALPLVITHGWPGSVFEFYKIIGPLTEPQDFGGDPADAFHVICPSMTGYAWSEPLSTPGCDVQKVAERQVELVRQLGYPRYGVQGGDWGSLVGPHMALLDPDRVVGIHQNMCPASSSEDPEEAAAHGVVPGPLALTIDYATRQNGYAMIQGLMPDQLGYALNDSPLGLAAWIVHCFYEWGDVEKTPEERFTKDELLTNVMIYWLTGSMPYAIRLYLETMRAGQFGAPQTFVKTPTGVALFRDLVMPKREWAERNYNIVQWTEYESGGHFAALEEPTLLVEDIRRFFRGLR